MSSRRISFPAASQSSHFLGLIFQTSHLKKSTGQMLVWCLRALSVSFLEERCRFTIWMVTLRQSTNA
jgi:hypothetical protein